MTDTLQNSGDNWGDPLDIIFRSAKRDPAWIYFPLAMIVLITSPIGILLWAFSNRVR